MAEQPRLRYGIEAIPISHQGQQLIAIRDMMGFSEETLIISPDVYYIMTLMDGSNSTLDIQEAYMRKFGSLLFSDKLNEIIQLLDSHYFLDNERFADYRDSMIEEFKNSPVRKAFLAGKAYPPDPVGAHRQLRSFFDLVEQKLGEPKKPAGKVIGLVAPHIDLKQGGPSYAAAYRMLGAVDEQPEVFIILGIGHEPIENYFAITKKHFETPLGTLESDQDIVQAIIERTPRDITRGEFVHRKEHSVEFQVLFLQYMMPEAKIVPILCSFGVDDWKNDKKYIDEFAEVLKDVISEHGSRVTVVAGVDLAHIGPRYGDNFSPTQSTVTEMARYDRELLDHLEKLDSENFMNTLARENDRRRVCGLPALYVMTKTFEMLDREHIRGKVVSYDKAIVDNYNSFVTFTGMIFTRETA
ncbi:MAG: AmmeMemoRadiSam system protein B [Deltaproteobacteria bacterium]|nr:MAG: AmmeMemoRadiSam system protein B [Deltaproteobacteria bacterium]